MSCTALLAVIMIIAADDDAPADAVALASEVDRALAAAHEREGLEPAGPLQDARWLRRLSLDVRGIIPTAREVEDFLRDQHPNRRDRKIDEYLADAKFSRTQARRWSSLLLTEGGVLAGRMDRLLRPWLESEFLRGAGFDEITHGILTAVGGAPISRMSASDEVLAESQTPAGFVLAYHDSIETTAGVSARVFLGLQIQCAQCHDHFFDDWTQKQFNQFTAFFSDLHGTYVTPQERGLDGRQETSRESGRTNAVFAAVDLELRQYLLNTLEKEVEGGMPSTMGLMAPEEPKTKGGAKLQSADETAALRDLQSALKSSSDGDLLVELEKDPARFEALVGRLPADMAEAVATYQHRRDHFADARFLDGKTYDSLPDQTRREALADWVTSPENPWYAKAIVNRVWSDLFGKGLTDPVDDLSGPASDHVLPELLEQLASAFEESGYDLRFLVGALVRTEAYARRTSAAERQDDRDHAARWFAAHPTRPMTSDQFIDSLLLACGVPTSGPAKQRARRYRNRMSQNLKSAFEYDSSELRGEASPSISHALFLMNNASLKTLMQRSSGRTFPLFSKAKKPPEQRLRKLFLTFLGRPPEIAEANAIFESLDRRGRRGDDALQDVIWSLLNSTEFHSVY